MMYSYSLCPMKIIFYLQTPQFPPSEIVSTFKINHKWLIFYKLFLISPWISKGEGQLPINENLKL